MGACPPAPSSGHGWWVGWSPYQICGAVAAGSCVRPVLWREVLIGPAAQSNQSPWVSVS